MLLTSRLLISRPLETCLMRLPFPAVALATIALACRGVAAADEPMIVVPSEVKLEGNFARAQLVVVAAAAIEQAGTHSADLTTQAKFVSSDPAVVSVNERGLLLAVKDGQATVTVTVGQAIREVP